ncbi:MAG: DUF2730 family protein [Pseudomonadota bacterium]
MTGLQLDTTIGMSLVFSIGTMIFAWFRTRRADVDERFKKGADRMDEMSDRITRLEQRIEALPARDDVHKLEIAMAEMAGEMKAMAASQRSTNDLMRRIETVVTRHEDHLLKG